MLIKINTKKYTADIEYINDKNITLKSGATLGNESPSLDPKLKTLRKTYAPSNTLTADLTFKSKSAIASFIVGSPQSGNRFFAPYLGGTETKEETSKTIEKETDTTDTKDLNKIKDELANKVMEFCIDFGFKPDRRCLNALKYAKDPKEHIHSFMELAGYPNDLLELANDKMKSTEWKDLIKSIKDLKASETGRINKRLIIKYGDAGCGKTTDAIAQYPKAKKIVAHEDDMASDLFTTFDPKECRYILTDLGQAMVNGEPIIIDEINLYNLAVLKTLQGVLDNTKVIYDRGIEIEIKDGFMVIATMNLETNLGKKPLPNPLISRAIEIENYDSMKSQDYSWVW